MFVHHKMLHLVNTFFLEGGGGASTSFFPCTKWQFNISDGPNENGRNVQDGLTNFSLNTF